MIETAYSSKQRITYEEAVLYCQFLEHNGHKDWRLPTKEECISSGLYWCWCSDRNLTNLPELWVFPVRDI